VEISVIIEPCAVTVTGAGGLSVGLTADGATAEEAIDRLAGCDLRLRSASRPATARLGGGVIRPRPGQLSTIRCGRRDAHDGCCFGLSSGLRDIP
jgi:hypothetical protein